MATLMTTAAANLRNERNQLVNTVFLKFVLDDLCVH